MPPEIQAEFFCAWWNNEDRAAVVGNDCYRLSKGHLYKNGENIDKELYYYADAWMEALMRDHNEK